MYVMIENLRIESGGLLGSIECTNRNSIEGSFQNAYIASLDEPLIVCSKECGCASKSIMIPLD